MKYSYTVQSFYCGQWLSIVRDETRDFCLGYLSAKKHQAPRLAHQLVRSDGQVIDVLPAAEDVEIGQIAGWPTPEQYEAAAQRAFDQAARIREQAAERATRRACPAEHRVDSLER